MSLRPLGNGHIHDTWLAVHRQAGGEQRLVLQLVNERVFPDAERMVANVARVAAHLCDWEVTVPAPLPAAGAGAGGTPGCARDAEGGLWRAYPFVAGTTPSTLETPSQARAAAAAFAGLVGRLADLPGPPLVEAIAGFHDFDSRIGRFEQVAAADACGRAAACAVDVEAVRAASWTAAALAASRATRRLPERTVHNDAKADNVVFAGERVVGLLDLDTVAPGIVLFDVGDLVRSGAATAGEDAEPAQVGVRPDIVGAIVDGYAEAAAGWLTDGERELLPLAGPLMAFELALRSLTDHLEGDVYFRIERPGQNLARARSQLALLHELAALPA